MKNIKWFNKPILNSDEMIETLIQRENKKTWHCCFAIIIKNKYNFEKEYNYDCVQLNYDPNTNSWIWEWDWDEGQQCVEFIGYINIEKYFDEVEEYVERMQNDNNF